MENIKLKKGEAIKGFSIQFFIEKNDGAEIYRVKDKEGALRRFKLYPMQYLAKSRFLDGDLLNEIAILSQINRPEIERLIDNGELTIDGGKYIYIVTDFISGETCLERLRREGTLNPYSVIPFVLSILETIEYLHEQKDPIIHNDISIENIVLSYTGRKEIPILTNFSSAIRFSQSTKSFVPDLLNPFYMAPEQMNGMTLPQSDLFAVGALMYQLCFGIPPWFVESDSRDELIDKLQICRKKPLSFTSNHLGVFDDHLLDVIKKTLALDINQRFKTAREFSKALKREIVVADTSDGLRKKPEQKKGAGFADIAGMKELKDILSNDVIRAINEKELYSSYGVTIPNGILLYGPPGCGKTFISEKFAEEIGFNFLKLNPSEVKSKYINATEENIGNIFKEAEEQAPTVLFFDEIDALVPSRDDNLHHMNASSVNEFLAQMSNCAERGIFIIAATNRPDKIDSAILRTGRVDKKIFVAPPDFEARKEMLELYLKKRPTDFTIDYSVLAEKTKFFVASDIKFIVDEASREALKTKSRISHDLLDKVILDFIPSISSKDLNYYEQMRNKLQLKSEDNEGRRPIGFR